MGDELLTANEVAARASARLGYEIRAERVRRWVKTGKLAAAGCGLHREHLFSPRAVDSLVYRLTTTPDE